MSSFNCLITTPENVVTDSVSELGMCRNQAQKHKTHHGERFLMVMNVHDLRMVGM